MIKPQAFGDQLSIRLVPFTIENESSNKNMITILKLIKSTLQSSTAIICFLLLQTLAIGFLHRPQTGFTFRAECLLAQN